MTCLGKQELTEEENELLKRWLYDYALICEVISERDSGESAIRVYEKSQSIRRFIENKL